MSKQPKCNWAEGLLGICNFVKTDSSIEWLCQSRAQVLKLSLGGFLYFQKTKMQLGKRLAWNLQYCKNWYLYIMALSNSCSSL